MKWKLSTSALAIALAFAAAPTPVFAQGGARQGLDPTLGQGKDLGAVRERAPRERVNTRETGRAAGGAGGAAAMSDKDKPDKPPKPDKMMRGVGAAAMSDKDKPDKPPKPDKMMRGVGAAGVIGEDGRVATGASARGGANLRRSGQQGGRAAVGPESPIQDTGQPVRPPR